MQLRNLTLNVLIVFLAGFANSLLPMYPWDSIILKAAILFAIIFLFALLWVFMALLLTLEKPLSFSKNLRVAAYPLVPKIVEGFSIAFVVYSEGPELKLEPTLGSFFKIFSFSPITPLFSILSAFTMFFIALLLLKPFKVGLKSILIALIPAVIAYFL